ncbi:MAG: ribosome maturation factor RimM [Pseudomonadota bacterium]
MSNRQDRICLGAIAGAWGVNGAVRLKSFCAEPATIADYAPLESTDGRTFAVTLIRPVSGAFAADLSGVRTREEAQALKGTRLFAPRDRLPELPDDEFYHADLIGLSVYDTGGVDIGRIAAVMDHGAGDFLEIARRGEAALLLPFTQEAVPTVDLAGRRVVIDLPVGLDPDDTDG